MTTKHYFTISSICKATPESRYRNRNSKRQKTQKNERESMSETEKKKRGDAI